MLSGREDGDTLSRKTPFLMEPENQDKLTVEIAAIYDGDYAIKVTLTPEEVPASDVVGIMRSVAALCS
jgi:hypothetical protein